MRKNNVILLLGSLLFFQGIFIFSSFGTSLFETPFIYGILSAPPEIEPTDAYDSGSIDVITQVAEGLYRYNLSSPQMEPIPNIASEMGIWSADNITYTVKIKNNVTFHDGVKCDATSIKWNFDRLNYFVVNEPLLQTTALFTYNGMPVLNKTEVVDSTTVNFTLNTPYKIWEKLLAFSSTFIIKPNEAYKTTFLTLNDTLIGTGPFKYDGYVYGEKVSFTAYDGYHRGKAQIPSMVWQIIEDPDAKHQAMLNHEVDMIDELYPEYLAQFEADGNLTVKQIKRTVVFYVAYNVVTMNSTMRKALSYATDKQYLIENIMDGQAYELNSPVPDGIAYFKNQTSAPSFNITTARQILLDANIAQGWGLSASSSDNDWITVGNSSNPIFICNFTTHSNIRKLIGEAIANQYLKIGVKMTIPDKITWDVFLDKMNGLNGHSKDELTVSVGAWAPDYNDPSNMIDPLYRNDSTINQFQLNDPTLEAMMKTGVVMADGPARQALYEQMQSRIAVDVVPSYYLWQSMGFDAWNHNSIDGYPSNVQHIVYFYPCSYSKPSAIDGYDAIVVLISLMGVSASLIIIKKRHH